MNSRLLGKGMVGGMLFLIGAALCAAVPPATKPASDTVKDSPDDSNPYSVIVERNIFHLNPPPPPPEPEKPKVEVPVIKITGFVDIGVAEKGSLSFRNPRIKKEGTFYYSLAEGESGADGSHKLELVKIHPSQDGVDVINDGVVVTLTVKDDTLGATGAPAPPAPAKERPGMNPGGGPGGRPMFRPGGASPPGVPGMPAGFAYPSRRRNLPQQ